MSSDGEESVHSNASVENVTEQERNSIRQKISTLSFEDLLKMKETLGSKVYNDAVFGSNKRHPKVQVKRANKNRPREISSKLRLKKTPIIQASNKPKKTVPRDPRFDSLCGTFDNKLFKTNYKFLHEYRLKEKKQLEEELETCNDVEEKKKIKYILQRMGNQIREEEKREKEQQKQFEEKMEIKDKLKRGEKPAFRKKSVKKLEDLIDKYETLKKTNKLQKHIEKKSKKLIQKERRSKPRE